MVFTYVHVVRSTEGAHESLVPRRQGAEQKEVFSGVTVYVSSSRT